MSVFQAQFEKLITTEITLNDILTPRKIQTHANTYLMICYPFMTWSMQHIKWHKVKKKKSNDTVSSKNIFDKKCPLKLYPLWKQAYSVGLKDIYITLTLMDCFRLVVFLFSSAEQPIHIHAEGPPARPI